MHFPPLYSLVIAFTILGSSANAASLSELRNQHYEKLNGILSKHQKEQENLKKRFHGELKRARKAATRTASLERMEALDREIFSSTFEQTVPTYETRDGEVARIRDVYSTHQNHLTTVRSNQIIEWLGNYEQALHSLEQKSILDNQVHLAKEARLEKAAVNESETVSQAREVASAAGCEAESETETKIPDFETDWHSLTGIQWHTKKGGRYFERALTVEKDHIRKYRGKAYFSRHLIYSHSPGKYEYRFATPITEFTAITCIEDRSRSGNVIFSVSTDEGEVHRSKEGINRRNRGEKIDLKFKPSRILVLEVHPNGEGHEDWAFWLNPAIRFDSANEESPKPTKAEKNSNNQL